MKNFIVCAILALMVDLFATWILANTQIYPMISEETVWNEARTAMTRESIYSETLVPMMGQGQALWVFAITAIVGLAFSAYFGFRGLVLTISLGRAIGGVALIVLWLCLGMFMLSGIAGFAAKAHAYGYGDLLAPYLMFTSALVVIALGLLVGGFGKRPDHDAVYESPGKSISVILDRDGTPLTGD